MGICSMAMEAFSSSRENFDNNSSTMMQSPLIIFGFLLLYLLIILLIGKWLWNVVLVKLVSIIKPATSVWQILGFAILVQILYGN
jgi:cytoskeletal protein RodZ